MRRFPFAFKHAPLPDSESMLFICNNQCQIVIDYLFLDKRMGSYDNIRFMVFYLFAGNPLLFRCHGTGDEHRNLMDSLLFKKLCHAFIMLPRQYFGRRHHRSLASVKRCVQKRQHRHDGLPRAYVSLHQAVHDQTACHIVFHLCQHLFLSFRQFVGKIMNHLFRLRRLFHDILAVPVLTLFL